MSKVEQKSERLVHTPAKAAGLLDKSRSYTYGLIATGKLKAHWLGERMVITDHDLREYLASLPAVKPTAASEVSSSVAAAGAAE
ncbi:helix-turn-helix domain-containing protein [Microvirga tunisiensis]|uniref:Helix-turn-helix domain-containing protein n=1 Tax=Microvirga tunisiensis TaxID=2108360 RepID=A0A5N7MRD4_9HYPH|nr:helix-turn-helix domain-containing protein [Microvirga tunisiensis]MPR11507.1 helix-turn-helix domain-containing protein [Microvirga tunisiensis]MPR29572.1 helix-turn-helix domain-containing protein [Microvirga tunisiensis]